MGFREFQNQEGVRVAMVPEQGKAIFSLRNYPGYDVDTGMLHLDSRQCGVLSTIFARAQMGLEVKKPDENDDLLGDVL